MTKYFSFIASASVATLTACGSKNSTESEVQWAHTPSKYALGSIYGITEFLRLGYKSNISTVRVCMGRNAYKDITDNQLELETKLAYAAWLQAASAENLEQNWKKFEFVRAKRCDYNDVSYASSINLPGGSERQYEGFPFNVPNIKCNKSAGYGASCSSDGITLGWGGVGSTTVYSNQQGKWTNIVLNSSSKIAMSNYINWQSLVSQIDNAFAFNGDPADYKKQPKIPASTATKIKNTYNRLAAESRYVSLNELVNLNAVISETRLIIARDPGFTKKMTEFASGNQSSINERYIPEYTLFHTLLHEVGHQFGMSHADNPDASDVTGRSAMATRYGDLWVTEDSAMAYGLDFAYLRQDDKLGVRDLAKGLNNLLNNQKSN